MQGNNGVKRSSVNKNVLSNYRLGKTLGMGAFAKVKLAVHNLTGIKVAIKIIVRKSLDEIEAAKVRREISMMKHLSHPHVIRLFEVIETTSTIYMVMEYVSSGELFYYLTENGRLDENEARRLFQQIISGIEYCHKHNVIHRDLKPENLLLDSKRNIKIIDFGLGNVVRDGHLLKTHCGSPNYAAPEVIAHQLYPGPEVDVWSCGVILYALLCARLPFDDDNVLRLYTKIRNGVYPICSHMSKGASDLISKIFIVDPVKRISIPEIRQHSWFQEHKNPQYISNPGIDSLYVSEKVNEDVLGEMDAMGFDIHDIIGSLYNRIENQATTTYSLLLHRHLRARSSNDNDKEHVEVEVSLKKVNNEEIYLKPVSIEQENWTLGFKSQASPYETMTRVLKVLQGLNVRWKRIGNYNVKCRYEHPRSVGIRAKGPDDDGLTLSLLDEISPSLPRTRLDVDAVKFELQLYKEGGEMYMLDLQFLNGPPLIFLQLCAAFLSAAGVI